MTKLKYFSSGIYISWLYFLIVVAVSKGGLTSLTFEQMADPRLRQLTIKTGVVKRLTKEKVVYEKEAVQQKERIERLKAAGEDEHVLRKQEEVLQEALMIIPDCQRRLTKAFEELSDFVKNEQELKETKEYETASQILEEAKLQLVKV